MIISTESQFENAIAVKLLSTTLSSAMIQFNVASESELQPEMETNGKSFCYF